ncbi:hypothetical protein JCM8547_002254 [Rhodosporidiobolus lusitaniae]
MPQPSADTPLTDAYLDPVAYLRKENLHRTLTFRPSPSPLTSFRASTNGGATSSDGTYPPAPPQELTVSYAVVGAFPSPTSSSSSSSPSSASSSSPPNPSASSSPPTLVWLNGMGHHRCASCLLDGLFASSGVRLITVDRPGAGRSTMVPLRDRSRVSFEALLAVLKKEGVTELSLLSHSNGLIYALYFLLHLPPHLTVKTWTLSSPYVPPWLSSHIPLTLARWVPPALTANLGPIAITAHKVIDPFVKSASWSAGVSGVLVELSGAWGVAIVSPGSHPAGGAEAGAGGEEDAPPPSEAEARAQRARFRDLNSRRPPHKQLFGGEFYGPTLFAKGMKIAFGEGKEGMGQEAQVCLRQGEAGLRGAWVGKEVEKEGVREGEILEKAFEALKERWEKEGEAVRMRVAYGKDDGLVYAKGRAYLRALLVDKLKLVETEKWQEIEDTGHDDPLGLVCIIEPMLEDLLAAHEAK